MENNKIFALVTIARQVEGEMVVVRFERAFTTLEKAQGCLSKLNFSENIETPYGSLPFFCERGIHELEIEE